jgi:hypothetical protein
MVSAAEALETRPDAVFVVGSGIDVPLIKPALEAATTLPLTAPEEPHTALARGAALASANAPLFVSSTAARAYAQDPGTGAIDPFAVAPGYFEFPGGADAGDGALAYSAVPDDFADPYTGAHTAATSYVYAGERERRSFGLVGSVLAAIFIVGVAALVVSLAIAIRPTAGVRPVPGHNVVAPAQPAPAAPAPAAPAPVPVPQAPAPVPVQQAPAPPPVEAPAPAPVPVLQAPAPAPIPVAPAPAPAPVAPVPVPIPLPLPPIIGGPGGGGFPGGGHGGGGFPGGGHGGFGGGEGHGGFGGGHGGFGRR